MIIRMLRCNLTWIHKSIHTLYYISKSITYYTKIISIAVLLY